MKDGSTYEVLTAQGYRLVDDAWEGRGRRTYLHAEDATRDYMAFLARTLGRVGWGTDTNKLRSFRHHVSGEIIEVEPGGCDVSGHFLHHMKASVEVGSG